VRASAAARRYARALFALARDASSVESVRGELDGLAALFDAEPELREALFRPLHPVEQRRAVLEGVSQRLSVSEAVRHFSAFLIDQRRLVDFEAIREEYGRLADAAAGRTHARVVSASPLSEGQRERLRRALAARAGQEVELEVEVEPSLLGGAIASVGTLVFDGSLKTQLVQLRSSLTRGS
jgi:F-type H+-transporting ATPase subunit delta